MFRRHTYSRSDLVALQSRLVAELGARAGTLGSATISVHGSMASGTAAPNDLDVTVTISRSLDDTSVRDASEDAIRAVVRALCFDGDTALILEKSGIWQWPLDAYVTDGTKKLYLQAIGSHASDVIRFAMY